MPVHKTKDGKWQFGKSGKRYYVKKKAEQQAKAIYASGWLEKGKIK